MAIKNKVKRCKAVTMVTISQAFGEFITEKEAKNLSDATLRNYAQSYELFCRFHECNSETEISDFTANHVFMWINKLRSDGVKPASINHYLRDLRAFFYWCMDESREYLQSFKIEMQVHQEEPLKLFTDAEIETLLVKPSYKAPFVDYRMWAIVNWVLATGNRAATICDVKIGDVDFSRKEITLRHTKNKRLQVIPLSSTLATILKDYIKMFRRNSSKESYMFPNVGDEKLTTNSLRHAFAKYCEDRGVSRTNIHGLRHNFAKAWVKANGNMYTLQTIMGHSSLDMTRKYVRLFADDIKEDFDRFNPLDNLKYKQKRTQVVKRYD